MYICIRIYIPIPLKLKKKMMIQAPVILSVFLWEQNDLNLDVLKLIGQLKITVKFYVQTIFPHKHTRILQCSIITNDYHRQA